MRTLPARKLVAEIFCLLLLPSMTLAQSALPDETRESLSRLIEKYRGAGQLLEAEKSLRQKLSLDEKTYGPGSGEVAEDLDTLSDVFSENGKYAEAETALKDALVIYRVVEGPQRSTNPFYMGRLASLAARQQRFADAEQLYLKILALQRKELGFENPATLSDLAELYHLAKDYPKSEAIYRRVVESKSLEPGSGVILGSIERLGTVYEEQGKFEQAEALYRNAVGTNQLILPHLHLTTTANLNDLGLFYERRERLQEAETYYRRALEHIDGLSPDASLMDSNLAIVIKNYARLLRKEGRLNESEPYESRAKTIENKFAPRRPDKVDLSLKGKVFRSDSNEAISNSYILLENPRVGHFDTRTGKEGEYLFTDIPPGDYTVSIYAWFPNESNVPCQNPLESKTVDGGKVTVEWQWKSGAFMEIVTIKGLSLDAGPQRVKNFDLLRN